MPSLLETHAAEIDAALQMHLAKRSYTTPPKVRSGQEFQVQPPPDLSSGARGYNYWITKDGWNPVQGLTRASFAPEPFWTGESEGPPDASSREFRPVLPARPRGRHVLLRALGPISLVKTDVFDIDIDEEIGEPISVVVR